MAEMAEHDVLLGRVLALEHRLHRTESQVRELRDELLEFRREVAEPLSGDDIDVLVRERVNLFMDGLRVTYE
jgi:hypothetical protein